MTYDEKVKFHNDTMAPYRASRSQTYAVLAARDVARSSHYTALGSRLKFNKDTLAPHLALRTQVETIMAAQNDAEYGTTFYYCNLADRVTPLLNVAEED